MSKLITFSKSNVYTRLTAETDAYMYDIVISNETGNVVFQMNSQTVESFPRNSVTSELMFAWSIVEDFLIEFAQIPFAEIKSKRYGELYWHLRQKVEKVNNGEYNRSS